MFDFNKIVKLRQEYPLGYQLYGTKDTLLNAIANDEYPYIYALLHRRVLEENKEYFFNKYHPDVIISINSPILNRFFLVKLNETWIPSEILTGVFEGKATTIDTDPNSKANSLDDYIGEHEKDFCDFLYDIEAFLMEAHIKRDDMNVIESSEFDMDYIHPSYYTKQGTIIRKREKKKKLHAPDFDKVVRLRQEYPLGCKSFHTEDSLFDAIQNGEYTYEYALINELWLNKNKKRFFTIYHPDVIIKIRDLRLDKFIFVRLNTNIPSEILMGEFTGKIPSWLDIKKSYLDNALGKHSDDFRGFLNNISNFVNGDEIERSDMRIIEYDEFDINHISQYHYTEEETIRRKEMEQEYKKFLKDHENVSEFNFDKTIAFARLYPDPENLLNAILNDEYPYKYALLDANCLEKNKEKFFAIYHPDVMIRIASRSLDRFILVHLNTAKPSKILTGVFEGNAYALDKDLDLELVDFYDYIGEYEEDFCDFQDNILKFLNGDNDINRKDMRVIEYDEFDINHIHPHYYRKEKIEREQKLNKFLKDRENVSEFNFNKTIAFSGSYEYYENLLDAILNDEYPYKYVLLDTHCLEKNKEKFFAKYHPDVMIRIESLIYHILVHLNTNTPSKVLTGVFEGNAEALNLDQQSLTNYLHTFFGEHEEDFCDFLDNISRFLNDKNADIDRKDMNVIKYNEFDINHIDPLCYSKQAIKIRNEIKEKDYKVLTDYVDVIDGPRAVGIRAKCLSNFTYPLKYADIKEEELYFKAVKIQKGDIIYSVYAKDKSFYLYNLDNNDVYVDANRYKILRCKDEKYTSYIVNYLNNKKMNIYLSMDINHFDKIKVINPTKEMLDNADKIQELIMDPEKRKSSETNETIRESRKIKYTNEAQKIFIDGMREDAYKIKLEMSKDIIDNDFEEVYKCFETGAYKATIILCGSVLETFLLDWLAEYEEIDDILKAAKYKEGYKKGDNLSLTDIIKELEKYIESIESKWEEKSKADEIRKSRNMVHPKVYIKTQNKTTKEECQKIIDDLKNIITRRQFYKR